MLKTILIAAVAVAFAAFVISRQVRRRRVTPRGLVVLPVWFAVLSLLTDHAMVTRLSAAREIGFFTVGIAFAGVMGVLRAGTLRVWAAEDGPWCAGGWRTGALWIVTIAVRVGLFLAAARLGATEGTGEAMIYVAVTLAAQNLLIARRAGLLGAGRPVAVPVLDRVG
jgi:hypothetical protein